MDFHSEARTKNEMWLGRQVLMRKNDRKKRREEYALCGVPRSTFTLKASGKQDMIENAQRAWKAVYTCQPETLNGNHSDRSSHIRVQTTSCHQSQPCHYNLLSLSHPQSTAACPCKACIIALGTHILTCLPLIWPAENLEDQYPWNYNLILTIYCCFVCVCFYSSNVNMHEFRHLTQFYLI